MAAQRQSAQNLFNRRLKRARRTSAMCEKHENANASQRHLVWTAGRKRNAHDSASSSAITNDVLKFRTTDDGSSSSRKVHGWNSGTTNRRGLIVPTRILNASFYIRPNASQFPTIKGWTPSKSLSKLWRVLTWRVYTLKPYICNANFPWKPGEFNVLTTEDFQGCAWIQFLGSFWLQVLGVEAKLGISVANFCPTLGAARDNFPPFWKKLKFTWYRMWRHLNNFLKVAAYWQDVSYN